MTDFLSMMGFRYSAINNIIFQLHQCSYIDENTLYRICSKNGIPFNDLTEDEKETILKEI